MKLLLAFDADINARDARDQTPLDVARESNVASIENFLIVLGGLPGFARPNPSRQGTQPIRPRSSKKGNGAEQYVIADPMHSLGIAYLPDIGIKKMQGNGCRVLCLDGGGIRGLVQIEVLCQLERTTGRKITELFDWVVGTSTGALILLAVIYGKNCHYNAIYF